MINFPPKKNHIAITIIGFLNCLPVNQSDANRIFLGLTKIAKHFSAIHQQSGQQSGQQL